MAYKVVTKNRYSSNSAVYETTSNKSIEKLLEESPEYKKAAAQKPPTAKVSLWLGFLRGFLVKIVNP